MRPNPDSLEIGPSFSAVGYNPSKRDLRPSVVGSVNNWLMFLGNNSSLKRKIISKTPSEQYLVMNGCRWSVVINGGLWSVPSQTLSTFSIISLFSCDNIHFHCYDTCLPTICFVCKLVHVMNIAEILLTRC